MLSPHAILTRTYSGQDFKAYLPFIVIFQYHLTQIMDPGAEAHRLTCLLEVEDLAFCLQLENAVSGSRSNLWQFSLVCSDSLYTSQQISFHNSLLQGFHDTSLTVGETAAVLRNYERRTGDVLKREDLTDNILATKLTPEDYNIKGQVSPHLTMLSRHACPSNL